VWVRANAANLNGSPEHVAVAGESAGGNLALSVALQARDANIQKPAHVLLVYPVASVDTDAPSYREYAQAMPLNKAMMLWFTRQYFRTPDDGKDPRINLVDADLAGLPPTTIVNAQVDPLRSDGELLAKRLAAAGVDVEQKTYDGVTHEFFGMGVVVDDARRAVNAAAKRLQASLR
jgi:acetyl esterase/lipase